MKNKDFDKLFRDKISQHQPDANVPDWEVFSEILKKSEGFEDVDFDKALKNKLDAHQAPFNENHWAMLKSRLEKEENLRKQIFSVKSLELIALLLLFLGWQTHQSALITEPEWIVRNETPNSPAGRGTIHASRIADIETYAFSHLAYRKTENPVVVALDTEMPASLSSMYSDAPLSPGTTDHGLMSIPALLPVKKLSLLSGDPINRDVPRADFNDLSPKPVSNPASKKYIMPLVSAGVGITQSGFDPIYNLKSYSTYSSQFAGGVMFCFKKHELETITGIKYTRRTHQPAAIVETYGDFLNNYYEISLDKIGYDIVEIPLGIKYHFHKSGKTSWYAKAGVSANFTLANHYTITNKPAAFKPLAPSNVGYASDGDNKSFSSRLSEKEFNPGLLQGGNLAENWFLTVSGELGMERKINDTHSLVLGAEYSKFYLIDGIGPNKDKLNGFALNVGIKKLLN